MEILSVVGPPYQKLHQAGDFPTLTLTCNLSLSASYSSADMSPEAQNGLTDSLSSNDICSLESGSNLGDEQTAVHGRLSYGNLGK